MAQSGGFQGLHNEHWQEVTHNANATLGEAVVSDINKSLGEVIQGAILLTIYMFFSPLQQVPHGRGFQVSPRSMLQQVKGRSWPVIGHIDPLWRASPGTQGDPGQGSVPDFLRTDTGGVGACESTPSARPPCSFVCRQV